MRVQYLLEAVVVYLLLSALTCLAKTTRGSKNDLSLYDRLFSSDQQDCLKKYLDHEALVEEFNAAMENNDLPNVMRNNCPKWKASIECYDNYVRDLKDHVGFFEYQAMRIIRTIILSTIDFFCANSGKRILDVLNEDGIECLSNNQELFKQCLSAEFGDDFINIVTVDKPSGADFEWSPTTFTGNECRLIRNATHCLLQTLKDSCSNYSHAFFHDLLIGGLKQTPCWGFAGNMDLTEWEQYLLAVLVPRHIPTKERICNNNETGFDIAAVGIRNASKCWNSILDNQFMFTDAAKAVQDGSYFTFIRNYCPKLQGVTTCIEDYLRSFQICATTEEEALTLEATGDIVSGIINFLCNRNGEHILLFMKEDGIQCLDSKKEEIVECVENAGVTELFQVMDDTESSNIFTNLWIPQNYRPEECKVMVALEVCTNRVMRKCSDRTPANLLSSLVRSVARKSPCWKVRHPNGASLQTSTYTVVNICAITALTVLLFNKDVLH